ncbi:hypothetical protein [Polynucleobacter sp. JS-Polo-80-F4]|uniref:hypothetical protein n=1 Tax=Polynucleobacter sp. JS-Polo-80-F4 TaxID=2576918 RepID=UPI001C0DC569|nr:hypothetical protein [Polynucleobacter sp. JS-Polo-80-F4]MBU3617055.1 hypothetical protein [Polynucleobacter sp. JS-Polo-80-F4]
MPLIHITPCIRLLACLAILLGLCACEREVYTSWNCSSTSDGKIPMVLRKAQMEFKGDKLDYCGSLGNESFFDQQCPGQTTQSSATFTPSSGLLLIHGQEFQCTAL